MCEFVGGLVDGFVGGEYVGMVCIDCVVFVVFVIVYVVFKVGDKVLFYGFVSWLGLMIFFVVGVCEFYCL